MSSTQTTSGTGVLSTLAWMYSWAYAFICTRPIKTPQPLREITFFHYPAQHSNETISSSFWRRSSGSTAEVKGNGYSTLICKIFEGTSDNIKVQTRPSDVYPTT
ncbi:hypothetical protein INR49_012327, partial [Caranx melampygus]